MFQPGASSSDVIARCLARPSRSRSALTFPSHTTSPSMAALSAADAAQADANGKALRAQLRAQRLTLPPLRTVHGSVLDAAAHTVAQQCNCCTVRSHGLSAAVQAKWPWADVYHRRAREGSRNLAIEADRPFPGQVQVELNPQQAGFPRRVAALFGQWAPGKPGRFPTYPGAAHETADSRLYWFFTALTQLAESMGPEDLIAMPHGVGCGLAGGHWPDYRLAIARVQHQAERTGPGMVLYRI